MSEVIALLKPFSRPVKSNKTLRLEVGDLTHKLPYFPSCSSSLGILFSSTGESPLPYLILISPHGEDRMTQSSSLARLRLPWNFSQNHFGRYSFVPEADKLVDHRSWAMVPNMWENLVLVCSGYRNIIAQTGRLKLIGINFCTILEAGSPKQKYSFHYKLRSTMISTGYLHCTFTKDPSNILHL